MLRKTTLLTVILLVALTSFSFPAFAQDEVTIDFWIPGGRGRDEGTAAVIEAFEAQNPHIRVELTATPFNASFSIRLQVAFAGNNPPDAALIDGVAIQNLALQRRATCRSKICSAKKTWTTLWAT